MGESDVLPPVEMPTERLVRAVVRPLKVVSLPVALFGLPMAVGKLLPKPSAEDIARMEQFAEQNPHAVDSFGLVEPILVVLIFSVLLATLRRVGGTH